MCLWYFRVLVLTAVALPACAAEIPKTLPKVATSVTGVLMGRSGKPMANAHLFMGTVAGDQEEEEARIILSGLPFAQTDAQGRFKLAGFAPDRYTIVYYPPGGPSFAPAEFTIKSLSAVAPSILPLMKDVEIGTTGPLPQRSWGNAFTLMKGHLFWAQGSHMKIWNATVRRGATGPYLEMRKGRVWQANFTDKAEVKMDAWSF
jgi:hypothetical protein